jgi:histidine triad (HIT) family protein
VEQITPVQLLEAHPDGIFRQIQQPGLPARSDPGCRVAPAATPAFDHEVNLEMQECMFCRIASGEQVSERVYQDDLVTAFHDIRPAAPIHILIIPNRHVASLNDLERQDANLAGHLLLVARQVAMDQGIAEQGYRLIVNTGRDGGQVVYHLHLHLLGGQRIRTTSVWIAAAPLREFALTQQALAAARQELVEEKVGAIVNAANSFLQHGGGLAGRSPRGECRSSRKAATGSAAWSVGHAQPIPLPGLPLPSSMPSGGLGLGDESQVVIGCTGSLAVADELI